jgi:hypothetical protein
MKRRPGTEASSPRGAGRYKTAAGACERQTAVAQVAPPRPGPSGATRLVALPLRREGIELALARSTGLRDAELRTAVSQVMAERPGEVVRAGKSHDVTVTETGLRIQVVNRAVPAPARTCAYTTEPR